MQTSMRAIVALSIVVEPAAGIALRSHRGRAAAFLTKEAHRLESPEFTALAQAATQAEYEPDGLKQVKSMIADMLVKKMDEHAQSTSNKDFCDKEMGSSKSKVDDLKHTLEKESADMDMLKAEIADDKDKISDMHESLVKNRKSMAEIAKMRTEQSNQDGASTPGENFDQEFAEKSKLAGDELALTRQQNQLEVDTKRMEGDIKHRERNIIHKTKNLSEMGSDVQHYQEEFDASQEYAETIQKQCVVPAATHEETQRRRQEEIESLREAHDIISGDAIP